MCKVQPYLCVNLLSIICGYNPDNINPDSLPIYLNYTPSGTSVKNMAKWAQVGKTRWCCQLSKPCMQPTCRYLNMRATRVLLARTQGVP